jgi:hypothetical protein
VVWSASLPDRIDGIGANGDVLSILSHDGTLATLNTDGKVTQSSVLSFDELARNTKSLEPAPAAELIASAQKRIGPVKRVKHAVALGNNTVVSYWGGTLDVIDNQGQTRHRNIFTQDITALASSGDKVVVGLADGRVMAISVK